MDLTNFKLHDWLMIGGGAAMLVFGLILDWTSVSSGGFSASGDGPFDYFLTGGLAWIFVVAVGVLAFLRVAEMLPDNQPWGIIFLGLTVLASVLMVLQIIMGARFDVADRGMGMWGALIWTFVALAGAVTNFRAGGGTVSDLTDLDKLKESFNSTGGDDVPPPPPPADGGGTGGEPTPPPADPPPPPPAE